MTPKCILPQAVKPFLRLREIKTPSCPRLRATRGLNCLLDAPTRHERLKTSRACPSSLGDVVTERSENHIIRSLRTEARRAGPRVAHHIGILRPKLQRSFWPLVEAIPEAHGALKDVAGIARARRWCGRGVLVGWKNFGVATRVVEQRRAIAHCRASRVAIPCAGRVLAAAIAVDIELRYGVKFKSDQALSCVYGSKRSVRADSYIGQSRSSVASYTITTQDVQC